MLKKVLFFILALTLFSTITINSFAEARSYRTKSSDVYVKGYYRKDGTYVSPYYRTPPNSTKLDNYSCIDNGNCGGSSYTPSSTNTYVAPVIISKKTKTEECQDSFGPNSDYSYASMSCYCSVGYIWNLSKNYCLPKLSLTQQCQNKYGVNALPGTKSDTCTCKLGYVRSSDGSYCELKEKTPTELCQGAYGLNSYSEGIINTDGTYNCSCNKGYVWNSSQTYCELKKKTPTELCQDTNGLHIYSDGVINVDGTYNCFCDVGYQWVQEQKSCILKTTANSCKDPNNSYLDNNGLCQCKEGYIYSNTSNKCINQSESCHNSFGINSYPVKDDILGLYRCLCNSGYVNAPVGSGRSCILLETACKNKYGENGMVSGSNSDYPGYGDSYSCGCSSGYILNNDKNNCIVIDNDNILINIVNTNTGDISNMSGYINTGDELYDAILWMYNNGLTSYSTPDTFMGNDYITREQASKFFVEFANKLGKYDDVHIDHKFTDVKNANSTLINYIGNAYSMGIMNGKNNKFMPFNNLTQAQTIAMLIRIVDGLKNENRPQWYSEYYTTANNYGILEGLGFNYTTLDSINITRGKVALLLHRAGNLNK